MSKLSSMTVGLVFIFVGLQLMLVKSYTLSPTGSRFMQQEMQAPNGGPAQQNNNGGLFTGIFRSSGQANNAASPAGQSWPYYQTGNASSSSNSVPAFQASSWQNTSQAASSTNWNGQTKRLAPPRWLAWPPLFLGFVLFLHGLALRQ